MLNLRYTSDVRDFRGERHLYVFANVNGACGLAHLPVTECPVNVLTEILVHQHLPEGNEFYDGLKHAALESLLADLKRSADQIPYIEEMLGRPMFSEAV